MNLKIFYFYFLISKMSTNKPILAIYTDGHCKPSTGDVAGYARITDQDGNCLTTKFKDPTLNYTTIKTPLGVLNAVKVEGDLKQQINYAEITALLIGIAAAINLGVYVVYTDSVTANAWSSGRIGVKITDPEKLRIVNECIRYRSYFEQNKGKIVKIEGEFNISDFGFHNKKLLNCKNIEEKIIEQTEEEKIMELCNKAYKFYKTQMEPLVIDPKFSQSYIIGVTIAYNIFDIDVMVKFLKNAK